MAAILW